MTFGVYLNSIFPPDVPGVRVLTVKLPKPGGGVLFRTVAVSADNDVLSRAARVLSERRKDVYLSIATQDWGRAKARKQRLLDEQRQRWEHRGAPAGEQRLWTATDQNTRGFSVTTAALTGFWVDADILQPGAHATDRLPSSAAEVFDALRSTFPLPPTIVINSGFGLYPVWLLREPMVFQPDDACPERARAAVLSSGLQQLLRDEWERRGWVLDPTADLARVFRPVGTFNFKLAESRLVEIIRGYRVRYNVSDLEEWIGADIPERTRHVNVNRRDVTLEEHRAYLPSIISGCSWIRHCRDDAAGLTEPEWFKLATVLSRCENGRETMHQWSKPYMAYSAAETDAKLDSARVYQAPVRCETIRTQLGGSQFCDGCVARRNGAQSPISLGYPTKARTASASAYLDALFTRLEGTAGDSHAE